MDSCFDSGCLIQEKYRVPALKVPGVRLPLSPHPPQEALLMPSTAHQKDGPSRKVSACSKQHGDGIWGIVQD